MSSYVPPGYVPNPLALPSPTRTLKSPDKSCQNSLLDTLSGYVRVCQGSDTRGLMSCSPRLVSQLTRFRAGVLLELDAEPGSFPAEQGNR